MSFILSFTYIIIASAATYFYGRFFDDHHDDASLHAAIFTIDVPKEPGYKNTYVDPYTSYYYEEVEVR